MSCGVLHFISERDIMFYYIMVYVKDNLINAFKTHFAKLYFSQLSLRIKTESAFLLIFIDFLKHVLISDLQKSNTASFKEKNVHSFLQNQFELFLLSQLINYQIT